MIKFQLKCKTDLEKSVIIENFNEREFIRSDEDDGQDWNVYWCSVNNIKTIFNPKTGYRLQDIQYINHFPNYQELTRKDLMVKNIKRYKRDLQKENINIDILPFTYILPGEYSLFIEEFHRYQATWIAKPSNRSQGKGIILINNMNQIRKIINELNEKNEQNVKDNMQKGIFQFLDTYVISKYLERPLLIGGKKFDLRLYVLVTSYHPLKAWMYDDGFARFCTETYNYDVSNMDNLFIHLTNVAVQKNSEKYNEINGGKWMINTLKFYIESNFGQECFNDIHNIVICSLKSVQSLMNQHKHCFELYGYDILLDENCRPWLIEINASPSLTTNCKADKIMKKQLMNDVFQVVVPQEFTEENIKLGCNWNQEKEVGKFTVLYDEQQEKLRLLNTKGKTKNGFWK